MWRPPSCIVGAGVGLLLLAAVAPRLPAGDVAAQSSSPDDRTRQIDRVFERWTSTASPGFTVGVVQQGRLVFARGYGMASLEHGVALTAQSPIYIASMSKQFTAAAAALLVRRDLLALDAPVSRYVPELRATGTSQQPLTIRQLIHHTGGVREWSSLALFAGQDDRFEQRIDNRDVLRMLVRQQDLEFEPGSRYRYSSGGYQVLTAVIERITGLTLKAFLAQEFFGPLQMTQTFVDDNYAAVLPGRVESYRAVGVGGYERVLKHFDVYGDGGIVTTVEDLARWDAALAEDRVGGPGLAADLLARGRLNDGTPLRYAFGLDTYVYRGRRVAEHGGGMLGFTVDMVRFLDEALTVIVLGNTNDASSTALAFQVADVFLGEPANTVVTPPPSPIAAAPTLQPFVGYYWSSELNFYRRIRLDRGQLVLDSGEGTPPAPLVPTGPGRFVYRDDPSRTVVFSSIGNVAAEIEVGTPKTGEGFRATRYEPEAPQSVEDLRSILGRYESDELAATYTIAERDRRVWLQIGDGRPIALFPAGPRVVWNTKEMVWIGFGEVAFRREADGHVRGLTIGDSRVTAIAFRKVS